MSYPISKDSFCTRSTLAVGQEHYHFFRLSVLEEKGLCSIETLPFSIRILLEQTLRTEDGYKVTAQHIQQLAQYDPKALPSHEIPFLPSRILMQDFTGVPAIVDLAALRKAVADMGKDPQRINPSVPVDLVIDHSVQVDEYGTPSAFTTNTEREFQRNRERYEFLHWAQKAFRNMRVIPPASGICHQVNLEYLAKVVQERTIADTKVLIPDTLVGTDSHTTMINAIGVLGWGVGGIEAEAALLGQPIYILVPQVVGVRLVGTRPPGTTATDLVLTITHLLRRYGVVDKFVEFFGPGVASLSVPDRATIANMCPEYGATCAFFPVDEETLSYLRATGRTEEEIDRVASYCIHQRLYRTSTTPDPEYAEVIDVDLCEIVPTIAGPKRPQDRICISDMRKQLTADLVAPPDKGGFGLTQEERTKQVSIEYPDGTKGNLTHGSVVIAAITSCTNTSNPGVMLAAGILAKNAVHAGLTVKPHVKTSLAPGSPVVMKYLDASGLTSFLEQLGFNLVGFGCTTCIGNSGPLPAYVQEAIVNGSLIAASVLSGNRNFEGRINPFTKASYLASPPLVVAYALAGTMDIDLDLEPLGTGRDGTPVYLRDIWPMDEELREYMRSAEDPKAYRDIYGTIYTRNRMWNAIASPDEPVYTWDPDSTYLQLPPFFLETSFSTPRIQAIENARVLVMLGDSVTTDHISPAGAISPDSEAGTFLRSKGVQKEDFNTYGSRRGNYEVMTRGTFANSRLRNLLVPDIEGGFTTYLPTGEIMSIYAAAVRYKELGIPVIVLAGTDYGMGSSRDWAAKGTYLLGVRAVLAESFERIHRSNLVGMGVLPLEYQKGISARSLGLTGRERFSIALHDDLQPLQEIQITAERESGPPLRFTARCRLDSPVELEYYRNGGILHTFLRHLVSE